MPDQSNNTAPDDDWSDLLNRVPQLPSPGQRWTARLKAAVIKAVRAGWVTIEEVCRLYNISVDEFLAWERDIDRNWVADHSLSNLSRHRHTEELRCQKCCTRSK